MTSPTKRSLDRAREIVSRLRKNINIHTEEWDEVRYLENKLAQALDQAREEQRERDVEILEDRKMLWESHGGCPLGGASGHLTVEGEIDVLIRAIRQDKPIEGGK